MITVLQRVRQASVHVEDGAHATLVGAIDRGVLLLVGVERGDTDRDADATAAKIATLRIFPALPPSPAAGLDPEAARPASGFDRDLREVGGRALVVSQFTLPGSVRRGRRPGFDGAARPELAEPLYLRVAAQLEAHGIPTATGQFGAAMAVSAINDGPFTLLIRARRGAIVEPLAALPGDEPAA